MLDNGINIKFQNSQQDFFFHHNEGKERSVNKSARSHFGILTL